MFCLIPKGFSWSEIKLMGSIVAPTQSPKPKSYGLLGYGQLRYPRPIPDRFLTTRQILSFVNIFIQFPCLVTSTPKIMRAIL